MTKAARFTKADIKRAVAGLEAAGKQVSGINVNDNGFTVLVGPPHVGRRNKADELYGPQA